mgnify:CR=1 FL=1
MATILERNKNIKTPKKTYAEHMEDALYREVWEDVNNEKTMRFIKKYSRHIIYAVIFILLVASGIQIGMRAHQSKKGATAIAYETALSNLDSNALASLSDNSSGATADLALFQSYLLDKDEKKLEKLAENGHSRDFRDLAKLHIAGIRGDEMSARDVEKYLSDLNTRTYLTIELGLQTIHEKTSKLINRGHTLKEFTDMVEKLKERNINIVVHIINGLPYETKEDMLETIKFVNNLGIHGIKIHMLHILKNTKLNDLYQKEKFHVLTKEEYIDIVCDQLELLNEKIIINRITGDPKIDDLVEPNWLIKKFCVLNDIDKELKSRGSYQGIKE